MKEKDGEEREREKEMVRNSSVGYKQWIVPLATLQPHLVPPSPLSIGALKLPILSALCIQEGCSPVPPVASLPAAVLAKEILLLLRDKLAPLVVEAILARGARRSPLTAERVDVPLLRLSGVVVVVVGVPLLAFVGVPPLGVPALLLRFGVPSGVVDVGCVNSCSAFALLSSRAILFRTEGTATPPFAIVAFAAALVLSEFALFEWRSLRAGEVVVDVAVLAKAAAVCDRVIPPSSRGPATEDLRGWRRAGCGFLGSSPPSRTRPRPSPKSPLRPGRSW